MNTERTCHKVNPLSRSESDEILRWWHRLQELPSERDNLRAAQSPEQLLINPQVAALRGTLTERNKPELTIPLLAGLLSHVRHHDDEMRFICRLGVVNTETGKPALSEVHFLRLNSCTEATTLYRRLLRAIAILHDAVDIPSLADCVVGWAETHLHLDSTPIHVEHLSKEWAKEYRQYLSTTTSQ